LYQFFSQICIIKNLKKYFFAFFVAVYLFSAIGVPVYLHYCGGELEEVSYLVKSNGCCGEEESDETSDCCHNEDVYLKKTTDFSLNILHFDFSKTIIQSIILTPFIQHLSFNIQHSTFIINNQLPPPKLCQQALLDCSVLKI
jgi:hypothetical protein